MRKKRRTRNCALRRKKEGAKEPMHNSDISTAQSNGSCNAHDNENTFSLRITD